MYDARQLVGWSASPIVSKLTLLGESWVEAVKGTARRGASSRGKEERAPVVHGLLNGRDGKDGTPGGTSGHTVHSPH